MDEVLHCTGCGRSEDEVDSLSEVEDGEWYCEACIERIRWGAE